MPSLLIIMILILVRHGETEENKNQIIQGKLPGTLSKDGLDQARRLALRLKDVKIDFIYSSDLARASDTAIAIQKHHPKIKIIYNKLLQEADFGDWTGKKYSDTDFNNPPKNKETNKEVQDRIISFFNSINNKVHLDKTVLIVSHHGCNSALLAYFMNKSVDNIFEIKQGNTAVNIINIKEDKNHHLELINCTEHLN